MSIKKEIEKISTATINQYLAMFYNVYADKNINKIDRLRTMRNLKNKIVVNLESMEDYIIENK